MERECPDEGNKNRRKKQRKEGKMELEFATGETYYPMASDHSNIWATGALTSFQPNLFGFAAGQSSRIVIIERAPW